MVDSTIKCSARQAGFIVRFKMRSDGRSNDQIRNVKFTPNFTRNPEGSCLVEFGNTVVLCTATLETKVPNFLKGTGRGWLSAEYSMLPRATGTRTDRESVKGKQSGRTQEIQRLIGRSLRAAVDMELLGSNQIKIDCDVLQADGGTRTASICGGFVALKLAVNSGLASGILLNNPIVETISAISCGIKNDEVLVDLDYEEDSTTDVDANFVINGAGKLIEVQACAEGRYFDDTQMMAMLSLARTACEHLAVLQKNI